MLDTYKGLDFEWIITSNKSVAVKANEVVQILGLNPLHTSRVLKNKVFPDYYFTWSENTSGRPNLYLYEPGVWQLLFSSNTDSCLQLQRHIFSEVLPSIRKQGFYLDKQALVEDSEKLALLESETAILKQENFALKQYIDDVPAKINQAKQVGIEQGKNMVTEQAKVEAKIDWQCETDVGDDPILFAKQLRKQKLEMQAKYDELNSKLKLAGGINKAILIKSDLYYTIKQANSSLLKTQLMKMIDSLA